MNIRIFNLPFSLAMGGFDDTEVRAFTSDKQVETIKDHAFMHNGVPHLSLVVLYHSSDSGISVPMEKNRAKPDEEWRKKLTPEATPLFNSLREWRSERAKTEGAPPYFICTNKQLVDIITNRPDSLNQLSKIEGIGQGKLEKYGKDILVILGTNVGTSSVPTAGKVTEEKKDDKKPEG